jgi:hypothetical protein
MSQVNKYFWQSKDLLGYVSLIIVSTHFYSVCVNTSCNIYDTIFLLIILNVLHLLHFPPYKVTFPPSLWLIFVNHESVWTYVRPVTPWKYYKEGMYIPAKASGYPAREGAEV